MLSRPHSLLLSPVSISQDNRRRIHLAEFVHIFSSTELIHTGPNSLHHPPASVIMMD